MKKYRAIISSDWNQCLAPCGPFDVISYAYPESTSFLESIFQQYTGGQITLGNAVEKIRLRFPDTVTPELMDAYLVDSFQTYRGVPDLMEWCSDNGILFMINTTGPIGYFQRVFAKGLLPRIPILSANSMIRYDGMLDDMIVYELKEIHDKGRNTAEAMAHCRIPFNKVILLGDSGGDGPHFEWGQKHSIYKIGCMAKQSLVDYCAERKITIDCFCGPCCLNKRKRDEQQEMKVDFFELRSIIEEICG